MNIEFIEFLHRKGVLFAFAINGGFFDLSFTPDDTDWIMSAFTWRNTPQGHVFWREIDDEWWEVCNGI